MSVTKSNILFKITDRAKPQVLKFVEMLEIAVSESKYILEICYDCENTISLDRWISKKQQRKIIELFVDFFLLVPDGRNRYYINPYFIYSNQDEERMTVEKLVFDRIMRNKVATVLTRTKNPHLKIPHLLYAVA